MFAQELPPGAYRDFFFNGNYMLGLSVPTNQPIRVTWGTVNRITGGFRGIAAGEATNRPNGRIIGTLYRDGEARGRLRGRVRDGGTNGMFVTGTFRYWSRDGDHVYIRRFHATSQ